MRASVYREFAVFFFIQKSAFTLTMQPNPTPLSDREIDDLARKRAGAKLGWYIHATVYLVVNLALFYLASQGRHGRPWSIYPALGWGLGLLLHGVAVFVLGDGGRLHTRLVERERERLRRNPPG